jgi:hypothetical protein
MTTAATITVSDRAPGLTSLQVSPATAALTVGGTQSVTASAQGPRAAAATMTYGTSAPAIATVSTTGVITAVAAGTATITVTAQSTQEGAFAASSLTGLVTVTVSNPAVVSINISALTQGPTTTSYASANNVSGIVSAANAQVGQPIDINNTRDQIQLTATLATNGARVDSVVAYVANADGTNRTSVGSQSFPSAAASGPVSLYINTADFTADFTAGTAAVKFANGQKRISVSAFSGATELQSTNSQTVNFNNVDGYASSATAPATTATNSAGQVWFGGPDSLTTRLGSATIVPVFYTAGRTLTNITVAMRQGAGGETQVCSEYLVFQTGPYKFVYGGARAVVNDTTVVNCSTLESAADHVVGVSAATDNNGSAAPTTSWAGGFRTSITVAAPVARKLDYFSPTPTAIYTTQTFPAVTGWVNGSWNFNDSTVSPTDAGVGMPGTTGTTAADLLSRKANRSWMYRGCGIGDATTTPVTYVTFSGSSAAIGACATNLGTGQYTIAYTDADLLGNKTAIVTANVSVDVLAPVVTWNSVPADSVQNGTFGAVTYTAAVSDDRSGISDTSAVSGYIARQGMGQYSATLAPDQRQCYSLTGAARASTTAGSAAANTLTCSILTVLTGAGNALQAEDVNKLRNLSSVSFATAANESMQVGLSVTDKAGNKSAVSTRRAMHDNTAPVFTITQPTTGVNATAIPTFPVTYVDRRIKNAYLVLNYSSVEYRYPAKTIGAGAFGNFGTPNEGNVSSTSGTTATASATTLTMPYTGTFVIATQSGAAAGAVTSIGTALAKGADEAKNSGTTASPASLTTVAPTALTATSGTFVVLNALTAAGGAEAGLKAQLTGAATTTTNPYERVDFYRQLSGGERVYLGSSASPTASLTGTPATTPVFTWKIDSYTTDFAGLANAAASTGDIIVAMGVRSTGAADLTGTSVIGGAAIKVTFAGLPAGVSATATLTGTNGFSQTIVSPNGSVTVPVVNGQYTLVGAGSVTSSIGEVYSNAAVNQTINVVGDAGIITATTYTYALAAANRLSVAISGLETSLTPIAVTLAKSGSPSLSVVAYNGTNTFSVPSDGAWTVTVPTTSTVGSVVRTVRSMERKTAIVTATSLSATTISVSGTNDLAVGDELVTASGASLGTYASATALGANAGVLVAAERVYVKRRLLADTHGSSTTTLTAGGTSYGATGVGVLADDRLELPNGFVVGTVASKTSTTVLVLKATPAPVLIGATLHHVTVAKTVAITVNTGATVDAASIGFFYADNTAGTSAIRTTVSLVAASTVSITPAISATTSGTTVALASHGTIAGGATAVTVTTPYASTVGTTYTITGAVATGTDGISYGPTVANTVVAGPTSSANVTTVIYNAAKLQVAFAGAYVGDLAGYTVPIAFVGSAGTGASTATAVSISASTGVVVPIAGTYSITPLSNIVIGNYTYTFTASTVSAVYGSTTSLTINVSRAALPAAAGALTYTSAAGTSSANFTGAWGNSETTVRTATVTLASGATVTSATCTATTAGMASGLIAATVDATTGVCTLTASGTAASMTSNSYSVVHTVTAGGPGLSTNTVSTTYTISRAP